MPLAIINPYGAAPIPVFTAWNSADKCADTTLSNGDLTAQCGIGVDYASVRTVTGVNTGEMGVWEITCDALALGGTDYDIGFGTAGATICDYPGHTVHSIGYLSGGAVLYNNGVLTSFSSYTTGDTIAIEWDKDANTAYFYKNGSLEGSVTQALTGGSETFPMVSNANATGQATFTANFGVLPFSITPQPGFVGITNP